MLICRRIALLTPAARFYSTAGSWRNNKECQVEVQGDASTKFRTGHLARFADGAVVASTGDTAVLATVVSDAPSNSDGGVPLIVDFKQSASAIGRIPTNYLRREMQQSDADIIASRIIDRSLRPLFPDRFNMPVQITCKPLSVAEDGDPVILGLNAASAALSISNIPWLGPVAAVRVGLVDDKIVINPARDIMKSSKLDLLVSGCHDRKVVMIEMDGQQISEDKILECFDTALTRIRDLLSGIEKLCNEVGKEKKIHNPVVNEALEKQVATLAGSRLYYIFKDFDHDKVSRDNAVKEVLEDVFRELDKSPQVAVAFSRLSKEVFRGIVTDEGWRCDGRSLTEFRPINSEVNLYNKLHGSAIFQRGQTQVMGTLTFDSPSAAFHPDSVSQLLGAQRKKMFMLHYEFPGFATNEVSTSRGVNRREMGHGMLAEKALKHVIPEDFPYSLRLACQVLESNGSSSMASACVGSLALMDAGVKILNPVAGAAIGLIKDEPSGKHTLLTDILGIEDYMGDMDFKVAGTREGFTAMQLDLKIKGLPMDVLGEALRRGSDGISHVLGKMAETLPEPRATFKDSVPVITSIDMPSFQRSILFRSGGYNVKLIEAETGVKVEQEDDKRIALIAPTAALLEEAQGMIKKMLSEGTELELDFGRIYEMKIVEICETGIKVSAKDGTRPFFVYNRELDQRNVAHASALGLKVGDKIRVSYYGRDPATGGQRLSCKRVAYGGATAAVTDLNRRR